MSITPTIKNLKEKNLVGLHMSMSLIENKTAYLWKNFMAKRHAIQNQTNNDLISLQVYDADYFTSFSPSKIFNKWACVEVSAIDNLLEGFQSYILKAGIYAVFNYKGISTDQTIFQYIYNTWLPSSSYVLDHRPHFEVLGEKYKNNDINSEEEIWIPIKVKS